ncbi:hypothetical protein SBY92_001472 [Candida maltosa Xu316]|uniref:Glutamine amidotransferase domain-containing protein n=1 Tax=Candida maltosa (strain Xu316) TaxID=1245528 RepID=M3K755_CANMX|nr:hypothetical protein G210_1825 [Candida maltosa Xu316]
MTSGTPKHIAVLVLDTPIPNVTDKHGDFGDNTIDLLSRASNTQPTIKYQLRSDTDSELAHTYHTLHSNIENHLITGFILTGSRCDAFGEDIWIAKLDHFIQQTLLKLGPSVPIVGICFGHQVLAKNLGCKIGRNDKGWEIGTHTIELNQEIFKVKDNPFDGVLLSVDDKILDHLNLVEFHQDIIYGLPPVNYDMVSIGSTVMCNIQGMLSNEGCSVKLLTFQGHPEFTTPIALDLLKSKYENNLIKKLDYEKYKYQTTSLNNQGDLIGKVIVKFFSN